MLKARYSIQSKTEFPFHRRVESVRRGTALRINISVGFEKWVDSASTSGRQSRKGESKDEDQGGACRVSGGWCGGTQLWKAEEGRIGKRNAGKMGRGQAVGRSEWHVKEF